MDAVIRKTELSLAMASEAINKMLVGAYLDCFSVSSLQVSLRFINALALPGISLYVDSNFSCEAALSRNKGTMIDTSAERFFIRRSKFLAEVYAFIGKEVTNTDLEIDGSLSISIGESIIVMQLSQEDMTQEESVWNVEMETPNGHLLPAAHSVVCVPRNGGISFLS